MLRKHPVGDEPPPPKRVYKKKDKRSNCPHCEKTFRCDRNCKEHIKLFMTNQRHLNVISALENLDSNELYSLINKLFIAK